MSTVDCFVDGRKAHRECVENHNSTIATGLEHGDCGDTQCCLGVRYSGPPGIEGALRAQIVAAWRPLSREERARRLGQPLSERQDGFAVRLSHGTGVDGSGVWGHVGTSLGELRAAVDMLTTEA